MKILALMILGLLIVGCATLTPEEKALRDSVVGEYELNKDGHTAKFAFLANGIVESYENGKKAEDVMETVWKIENGELHMISTVMFWEPNSNIKSTWPIFAVCIIESNGDLTFISIVEDGKREDIPKDKQITLKIIK